MLVGDLTSLRAIEPEDLAQLREWRNRPELRRYFREYRELTIAAQRIWYEGLRTDRNTVMFAIVGKASGNLYGAAGLCAVDWIRRSAEVSLYLGESYVDETMAPDALRILLRFGFGELGLHRTWAEVYGFDDAKAALLADEGFLQEGWLRDAHWTDGFHCDTQIYAQLDHEFWRREKERDAS